MVVIVQDESDEMHALSVDKEGGGNTPTQVKPSEDSGDDEQSPTHQDRSDNEGGYANPEHEQSHEGED